MFKTSIMVLFILIPMFAHCTAIYIYIIANRIFVSADSWLTRDNHGKTEHFKTICKVNSSGKFYFAIAGHGSEGIRNDAEKSFVGSKSYDSSIEAFKKRIIYMYANGMPLEKQTNPQTFNYWLHNDLAVVAFFYYDKKTPVLNVYRFVMTENKKGSLKIKCIPYLNSPTAALGFFDHKMSIKEEDETFSVIATHPEKIGESIVRFEMKFHKEEIGEPIDVMELTPRGMIYYSPKRNCN